VYANFVNWVEHRNEVEPCWSKCHNSAEFPSRLSYCQMASWQRLQGAGQSQTLWPK